MLLRIRSTLERSRPARSSAVVLFAWANFVAPTALAQAAASAAPPASSASARPLSESLTGMARAEYEAGRILYADGDFAGAALKFERAYEESKDPRLLWNIAAAEKNLRRYVRVYTLIERYLAEAGPRLTEQDRSEAQALLATVRGFIGEVTITVDQPGAEIFVDDQLVGKSPLSKPVLLEMGERKVRVKKPGFSEFAASQSVAGGTPTLIEVSLQQEVHEGQLRVVAGSGDTISIDGKVVGRGLWEGTLSSGIHSVEVHAPGKRPYQADVGIRDRQLSTVRVTLENESVLTFAPERSSSASPWPWIAGGVLVAGLGVGAYFLFRPDDEEAPRAVDGSLDPGAIPLSVRF